MKLKTPYKTVMFYGNVLRINRMANWIAVDFDGRMTAFVNRPRAAQWRWESTKGSAWILDAIAKFDPEEDWRDTLAHCPYNQEWMIDAGSILELAHNLDNAGVLDPEIEREILRHLKSSVITATTKEISRQTIWKAWMKHAVPEWLYDKDITRKLRDKTLPPPAQPDILTVENYYGRDIVVPPWTAYIAMDRRGSVRACENRPDRDEVNRKWKDGGLHTFVAWYPPEVAKQNWRDSLREVQS